MSHDLEGNDLVAFFVVFERHVFSFGIEHAVYEVFGNGGGNRSSGIWVECPHNCISDVRADAEGGVRRESPGSGCPGQEAWCAPAVHHRECVLQRELCDTSCILYIAVAAGLVELVRAEACSGGRGVGLDGIAFVQESFAVDLAQEPPYTFDITVVVSDVGIGCVDPVSHFIGKSLPFVGVFHHFLTAGGVVVVDRYLLSDIFFLDSERAFDTEFDGQTVSVPSGFTLHMESFHSLVPAEQVFDSACHDMMYARHAVCGRRTFEEYG